MKYQLTLLFLLSLFISVNAQKKLKKELDSITSIERANEFIELNKDVKNKIITFNEEKHKTKLSEELLSMPKGGHKMVRKEDRNVHYKIIEKNKIDYYRVSYILLDGKQYSQSSIDALREKIILKHKQGFLFKDLAEQYSMDNNRTRGGDSGWFTYGELLPEFETQIVKSNYEIDELFKLNVESNQWYYVVKKTHDKKQITEIKVLRYVDRAK